jgi:putative ABC transport system permease protein
MLNDWKHAFRGLLKNRGMTLTAIAALALGIGANTALFTVVNAVLLRPMNYPHPERIVQLTRDFGTFQSAPVTPFKFDFWRRQNHSFEAIAAYNFGTVGLNLVGHGEPLRIAALPITSGFFKTLAVSPWLGNDFQPQDDKPGAARTAIISYALWHSVLHADPHVIGRVLTMSDSSYTVVGVMPRDFDFPTSADIWTPLQLAIDPADRANDYQVLARLNRGVSLEQAQRDMRLVASQFRQQFPGEIMMNNHESVAVLSFHSRVVGNIRPALLVLMSAVGFVLLIACANVANLLLARSVLRAREMAVRVALGAGHWRIIRLLLAESLTLSLLGGAAGVLLAQYCLPLLLRLAPSNLPSTGDINLNWTVIGFATAAALATGIVFGLFPALQVIRSGIIDPIKESAARTTSTATTSRARQILVVAEVSLSLVLLVGAGLLVQTFRNLTAVNPGFDARNVLTLRMSLTSERFQKTAETALLNDKITRRLESLPGVESAATISNLPTEMGFDDPFEIVGRRPSKDILDEDFRVVSPHYFQSMKIPLVSGRAFTERDTRASQPVIIVNSAFARKYFPHENPLGQQILVGRIMGPDFADAPRAVIGVVGDTHDEGLGQAASPVYFEPVAQLPDRLMALGNRLIAVNWVIRTSGNPLAMADLIRRETLHVTGQIPMSQPRALDEILGNSISRERFTMTLLLGFAGLATLLSAVGLYGVISYSVAQRTREFGIRSALGADRMNLLSLVLKQGMLLVGLGLAIGVVSGLALTRLLRGLLFQVNSFDPSVLIAAAALLATIALCATMVPALRAAKLDPVSALREG